MSIDAIKLALCEAADRTADLSEADILFALRQPAARVEVSKAEADARERIKASRIRVGSDLHLCEMLLGEIDRLRTHPAAPVGVQGWLGAPLLEWALGQIDEMNDGPLTADEWAEDAAMYQQARDFLAVAPSAPQGG